jgi:hypothetical protein
LDPSRDVPLQEEVIMQTAATMFVGGFIIAMSVVTISSDLPNRRY